MVDCASRDGVDVFPDEQLAEVFVMVAVISDFFSGFLTVGVIHPGSLVRCKARGYTANCLCSTLLTEPENVSGAVTAWGLVGEALVMKRIGLSLWIVVSLAMVGAMGAVPASPPRTLDSRLVFELIAAEPEIVTPTGIAVDHAVASWSSRATRTSGRPVIRGHRRIEFAYSRIATTTASPNAPARFLRGRRRR